jgi:hypothetical protein
MHPKDRSKGQIPWTHPKDRYKEQSLERIQGTKPSDKTKGQIQRTDPKDESTGRSSRTGVNDGNAPASDPRRRGGKALRRAQFKTAAPQAVTRTRPTKPSVKAPAQR